jgi:hypothetical protein
MGRVEIFAFYYLKLFVPRIYSGNIYVLLKIKERRSMNSKQRTIISECKLLMSLFMWDGNWS